MGTSEVSNDGGRMNYKFRGGANQSVEAGSDQEKWTIRLDMGADADMFRFELTRPDGNTIAKLSINSDGHVELFGAKGVDLLSGDQHTQKHLRDREIVVKNNDTQVIGGSQSKKIQGSREAMVSSNETTMVGNDRTVGVVRHETHSVGGKLEEKIAGGNPLTAKPGDTARETTINNGGWKIDIGNPIAGASPAALAGFDLSTFSGDIKGKVKTAGMVTFSTILGNVELSTVAGNAALTTLAGIANVDGTSVNLGPVAPSFANPVLKGTIHNAAFSAYLSAEAAAIAPYLTTLGLLEAFLAPPLGMAFWLISPIMSNLMFAATTAQIAMLSTWIGVKSALTAALPTLLSTIVFTA
jgi:hypothetical protein